MGGKKAKSKPLFSNIEWWKSPIKRKTIGNNSISANDNTSSMSNDNNDNINYGSMPSNSSYEPIVNDDDEGEPIFLIDKMVPDFPECLIDSNKQHLHNNNNRDELIGSSHQLDVPSDISNQSSVSGSNDSSHDGSSYDSDGSEYEDDIEQPHRTLGLLFFDFLRFVTIGVNVRCVNTQMVPLFLAWGRMEMELLHIALRIFMTLFSLLLILVEFPDLLPCLQHAPPSNSTTSPRSPPLYIVNWIPRGIFYVFLSTICFEQSIVVRALDAARNASTSSRFFDGIFIVLSAWFMLVVGVVYILLGLFCIQKVMERVRKDEKEKWKEYYELVQRMELEKEEAEEREWLLENGEEGEHGTAAAVGGGGRRCWQRLQRWRRRCKRRRLRGGGGVCYQLGCRTVDWRC